MDDVADWGLYAMVRGFCPTMGTSSSSSVAAISTINTSFIPTTAAATSTSTPIIPLNNYQMLAKTTGWNLDSMVDGFYPTIDASSSSLLTIVPTTTPNISQKKSQVLGGIFDWNSNGMLDGLYPTIGASSSSFGTLTPSTTIAPIPANTTTSSIHSNNNQILDGTTCWNLHDVVNGSNYTHGSLPSTIITPTIPMEVYRPQYTTFGQENSNQLQSSNKNDIMQQLMPFSNNTPNVSNKRRTPLSSKDWPILSLPCLGKIPEPTNHQPKQQNKFQGGQETLNIFSGTSKSKKREGDTKRIYKMPPQGLKTELWTWKEHAEKFVNGSPYPRTYYICATSDCKAKKRVERSRFDQNSFVLKYKGHHNHPIPHFMKDAINDTNNNPTSSGNLSPVATTTESSMKKKNDDDIFEGLENLVDL